MINIKNIVENDEELLYMIRQQDEMSLQYLIQKYEHGIYALIRSFRSQTNRAMDISDFYQLALLKLLGAIEEYRSDAGASFRTYYFRILKYTLINHVRQMHTYAGQSEKHAVSLDMRVEEGDNSYQYSDILSIPESVSLVTKLYIEDQMQVCLEELNEVERSILLLRGNGLSYKEIAESLHIKIKKVDNTLRKVRRRKKKEKHEMYN